MPTAAAGAPSAPRAATVRLRGVAAPLPPTTTNKRARPPTADSPTLVSSPLRRPPNDVIVVFKGPYRSPTKRNRTAVKIPPVPFTPPSRDTAPATPPTPSKTTATRTVPPIIAPFTFNVPKDVARIYGILDGYADALTTALSIVYKADYDVGAAVDTIL